MIPVPVGQIWKVLETKCKVSGTDDEDALKRMLNLSYYQLVSMYPWRALRRILTATFSASDSNGFWFPANMAGVYQVVDTEGHVYHYRDVSRILDDETIYRWFFSDVNTTPAAEGNNLNVTPGRTAITGPDLADHIGEFIHIGSEMGVYEITANKAISPAFRGKSRLTNQHYSIRPEGTQRVSIVDNTGLFAAATTYFYYWSYPPPLTQEHHLIQLPTTKALELLTAMNYWQDYKGQHKEGDRFRAAYKQALADMKMAEPESHAPIIPRDTQGRRVVFGRRK